MKDRLIGFIKTYCLFVCIFVLQKPLFMLFYESLYPDASCADWFSVMWHGLPLDLSLAGYLTAIPGFLFIASVWTLSKSLSSHLVRLLPLHFCSSIHYFYCRFRIIRVLGIFVWMPHRCSISFLLLKMQWPASVSGWCWGELLQWLFMLSCCMLFSTASCCRRNCCCR